LDQGGGPSAKDVHKRKWPMPGTLVKLESPGGIFAGTTLYASLSRRRRPPSKGKGEESAASSRGDPP